MIPSGFGAAGLDRILPDGPETRPVTWRWFWPVLALALLGRIIVSVIVSVPLHADETFQYLEQGYRLVHGYGVIPWEYAYGIRSWFIPISIAGVLSAGKVVGLDRPWEYIPLVEAALCIVSLSLPVGMYRFAQRIMDERGAIIAFLFGCFWAHFLYYAHKPMPGILAVYALIWMCALMVRPPSKRRLFTIGLLSGLVLVLRYQLVPVVALLNLLVVLRVGWTYRSVLAGNVVMAGLAGLIDFWSWGGFLFSFVENFRLNFLADVASGFGRGGPLFYTSALVRHTAGLVLLAPLGIWLLRPRLWPFAVAVLVGVAALHVPDHKEWRFLVWVLPFIFVASAGLLTALPRLLPERHNVWRVASAGVAVWAILGTGAGLIAFGGLPGSDRARLAEAEAVFLALARSEAVMGVEMLTPSLSWWNTAGYYALGKPVPVYFWGWHERLPEAERRARLDHVSHVVAGPGQSPPEGYTLSQTIGRFRVFVADVPRLPADFDTFDLHAPVPEGVRGLSPASPLVRIGPALD